MSSPPLSDPVEEAPLEDAPEEEAPLLEMSRAVDPLAYGAAVSTVAVPPIASTPQVNAATTTLRRPVVSRPKSLSIRLPRVLSSVVP